MKSKPNVRGGGQNRSKIKTLEKEVADLNEVVTKQSALIDKQDAALGEAIEKAQILADALQAKDKLKRASHGAKPKYDIPERLIRPTANLMFREEGGADFELCLESYRAKHRAFLSQINAKERDHSNYIEGPPGWGPNITAYEDRMNNSQVIRLRKEIKTLMDRCRQIVREAIVREIEEGRRDPETFEMIRGAREANQGLEPEASAKGHAAKAANLVGGESKLQDPNGPFARSTTSASQTASGSKQIPPEPVIDFEVTDELVAEWVKWQTSQGKHIPPHHAPVMAALQRAGQDSVQLPPKIAELTERVIKTVEAQQQIAAQSAPVRRSLGEVGTAGVETE